ncbi:MAG: HAD family hydrolase [Candidatus Hodarchaeales archaeon]|jgi:HAD superfamily phosphoserine phosphatase-like hydrolase
MQNTSKEQYLIAFDLDGTLTTHHSSWQFILEETKKWEPLGKKNLELFLDGKLKGKTIEEQYLEFCRLDAELLKGLDYQEFLYMLNKIIFRDHIKELIFYLKRNFNSRIFIISAGFKELAEKAKQNYGFDSYFANELGSNNGILDGSFKVNTSWFGKKEILSNLKEKHRVEKKNVISFGDTSGDFMLFEESGLNFACFEANREVINKADYHITDFLEAPKLIKKYVKNRSEF